MFSVHLLPGQQAGIGLRNAEGGRFFCWSQVGKTGLSIESAWAGKRGQETGTRWVVVRSASVFPGAVMGVVVVAGVGAVVVAVVG